MESIAIDIKIQKRKGLILGTYKPPSVNDTDFCTDFISTIDKVASNYDNLIVVGDLNFDVTSPAKSEALLNVCDVFDLHNLIKSPTCFTKTTHHH